MGIPRHIHQIWIGPNPCPEIWIRTVRAFCAAHKYNYTLWNEAAIQTALNFDAVPRFREAYERQEREQSLPGRCDLLRYLILWTYGGIYLDADTVVVNSRKFHTFLETQTASLFLAWEDFSAESMEKNAALPYSELDLKGRTRILSNGTIGAMPKHSFLRAALEGAADYSAKFEFQGAWRSVGPAYLTNLYDSLTPEEREGIVVHPMRFFYPIQWGGITDPEYHLKHALHADAMLFQYGYSTNKFDQIFRSMGAKSHIRGTFRARAARRRRQTRKSLSVAPPASLVPHPPADSA